MNPKKGNFTTQHRVNKTEGKIEDLLENLKTIINTQLYAYRKDQKILDIYRRTQKD